jgi:hypothetical protein
MMFKKRRRKKKKSFGWKLPCLVFGGVVVIASQALLLFKGRDLYSQSHLRKGPELPKEPAFYWIDDPYVVSGIGAPRPAQHWPESTAATAFIIRTYNGHNKEDALKMMLQSLIQLDNPRWAAFVFNTDSSAFASNSLRQTVADLKDARVMLLNDVAATNFSYWDSGYLLTDQAIAEVARAYGCAAGLGNADELFQAIDSVYAEDNRRCPFHWLVSAWWVGVRQQAGVGGHPRPRPHTLALSPSPPHLRPRPCLVQVSTNGDNLYLPQFLDNVDKAAATSDVVAVDFFSRWDPAALSGSLEQHRCYRNLMSVGRTDVGSNIWNLQRWLKEGVQFTQFGNDQERVRQELQKLHIADELVPSVAAALATHDGKLALHLTRTKKWRIAATNRCDFSHSPNP